MISKRNTQISYGVSGKVGLIYIKSNLNGGLQAGCNLTEARLI